jgi:hypothetical protein
MVELAVEDCSAGTDRESDKVFQVIDAFSVPRLFYNSDRKKFIPHSADESVPCLHGSARAKSDLFKERYSVLHQVIVGMTT